MGGGETRKGGSLQDLLYKFKIRDEIWIDAYSKNNLSLLVSGYTY